MSRKGRISYDRVEALEKEVTELKDQMRRLVKLLDDEVAPLIAQSKAEREKRPANQIDHINYVPQFDRWPGNER